MLSNPGLRQLFLEVGSDPEWTCYFPHPQRVVCGGISIPDRWDLTPEPQVTEQILQRCRRIEPRLAEAEVIEAEVVAVHTAPTLVTPPPVEGPQPDATNATSVT